MAETVIVTPDQIEMRPGTRGYIKGLTVMHVNEGAPYITFLESAPNHYAQVHSHSEDEVMVVVMGRMLFNGRWCDVGSLIFVPAHEEYWYSTGDEGCRVALIRPKGRGTFENGREDIAGDPAKPASAKPDSTNSNSADRNADNAAR
jgi:mannose-6-phosphate isomerase-like protein (cupin superfamily)